MAAGRGAVDLSALSDGELIAVFGDVMAALRERGVVRSDNNPIADIAERLVADYYGGKLAAPNEKSYDVVARDGRKLQVKALRLTRPSASGLSPFRSHDFDAAVIVVFHRDMRVH